MIHQEVGTANEKYMKEKPEVVKGLRRPAVRLRSSEVVCHYTTYNVSKLSIKLSYSEVYTVVLVRFRCPSEPSLTLPVVSL